MYYENNNDNMSDFLLHLKTIMTSNGWTILEETAIRYVFESVNCVIIFELEEQSSGKTYLKNYRRLNINILDPGTYSTGVGIYDQTTGIPSSFVSNANPSFVYQMTAKSKTFISINENRLLFVMLQKGFYQSFYAGKFFQYAGSSQYLNPLCYTGTLSFNDMNIETQIGQDTGSIMADGSYANNHRFYKNFNNDWATIIQSDVISNSATAGIYPWVENGTSGYAFGTNIDGGYTAIPTIIFGEKNPGYAWNTDGYLMGELEGLFGISSIDNSPENTFIFDGDEYICFPSRDSAVTTSEYFTQYFAIKKS